MAKITRNILILSILFLNTACKTYHALSLQRPINWAQKIELTGFHNLYKVDNDVYRSENPDWNNFLLIDSIGIKTIVNLRVQIDDNPLVKSLGINLIHIPLDAWTLTYEDVVSCLKIIDHCKKPVLVHCLHGSDRTGCIIAAYRMAMNGWTKEEAITEFREGGFGYHEKWFPNILRLLNSIDVEKLKKDVSRES